MNEKHLSEWIEIDHLFTTSPMVMTLKSCFEGRLTFFSLPRLQNDSEFGMLSVHQHLHLVQYGERYECFLEFRKLHGHFLGFKH